MNEKARQLIALVDPAHTDPARAVRCVAAAFEIDEDDAADMVLDMYQSQRPRRTWAPHDEVVANGGVITSEVVLRMLERYGQQQEAKQRNRKQ